MRVGILNNEWDKMLKPLGFVKKQYTRNRQVDQYIDVINVQIRYSQDAFTLNVGVLNPDILKGDAELERAYFRNPQTLE